MNSTLRGIICAGVVATASAPASAALFDRGNGLIYDSVLDVTWMQDASYAGAGPLYTQDGAMAWADSLSYGGFDDWRLPSTLNVDPSCSTDDTSKRYLTLTPCSGGELGHLIYEEGLVYQPGDSDLTPNLSFGSLGLFENVYSNGYWTSEEYVWTGQDYEDPAGTPPTAEKPYPRVPENGFGWLFYVGSDPGGHKTILRSGNKRGAWAVRDGDVLPAVPIPAAVWLFGSALLGLVGLARRNASQA